MSLEQLQIQHLRNIHRVRLGLSPTLNIITGANASGKTSLLEAIYLLASGRSFRSSRLAHVVEEGETQLTVFAQLKSSSIRQQRLGLQYEQGKRTLRLDGETIRSGADLAQLVPLQLINQQSFDLIDQGPSQRRKFLDWGVFHVEHQFYPAWQQYMRAMKQRNAALRQNMKVTGHWEQEMARNGEVLHRLRADYVARLEPVLLSAISEMLGITDISLHYRPGWDTQQSLAGILAEHRQKDTELGYSRYGPQRADLVFKRAGAPARERLSRGQQKLLVSALILAQASLLTASTGRSGTVLIDDISAELDEKHCARLMQALLKTGAQLVVTAISPAQLPVIEAAGRKMFHVERGVIEEVV